MKQFYIIRTAVGDIRIGQTDIPYKGEHQTEYETKVYDTPLSYLQRILNLALKKKILGGFNVVIQRTKI